MDIEAIIRSTLSYDQATGLVLRNGRACGHTTRRGYVQIKLTERGEFKFVYAHRVAWFLVRGEWPESDIDHVSGDKSDNRWANLRAATRAQNQANHRSRADNTSGYKGVFAAGSRWKSQIKVMGKTIYLGQFGTPQEAAAAYDAASIRLQGEFSYLNGVAA